MRELEGARRGALISEAVREIGLDIDSLYAGKQSVSRIRAREHRKSDDLTSEDDPL